MFINCPFDADYELLLDAIILCILCCRLEPRCALETGSPSDARIDRITQSLIESQYSIHDLSRCEGEGEANLARFNMPLELGFAMALRRVDEAFGRRSPDCHGWYVLIPEQHKYSGFVSDLAGFDPGIHAATPETIVRAVLEWLITLPRAQRVRPKQVMGLFEVYQQRLADLRAEWHGTAPWSERLQVAADTAQAIVSQRISGDPAPPS